MLQDPPFPTAFKLVPGLQVFEHDEKRQEPKPTSDTPLTLNRASVRSVDPTPR